MKKEKAKSGKEIALSRHEFPKRVFEGLWDLRKKQQSAEYS